MVGTNISVAGLERRGSRVGEQQRKRLARFYADLPAGTVGTMVKTWTDPAGCVWYRLFFGRNLSGQPIRRAIPADCLVDA